MTREKGADHLDHKGLRRYTTLLATALSHWKTCLPHADENDRMYINMLEGLGLGDDVSDTEGYDLVTGRGAREEDEEEEDEFDLDAIIDAAATESGARCSARCAAMRCAAMPSGARAHSAAAWRTSRVLHRRSALLENVENAQKHTG